MKRKHRKKKKKKARKKLGPQRNLGILTCILHTKPYIQTNEKAEKEKNECRTLISEEF